MANIFNQKRKTESFSVVKFLKFKFYEKERW